MREMEASAKEKDKSEMRRATMIETDVAVHRGCVNPRINWPLNGPLGLDAFDWNTSPK